MDRTALRRWVESYERAWRTPGTDSLAELFAPDATYSMAPFEEDHRGLDAIAELWEAEREGPDEIFTMESEILAVEGDTGVVRVEVRYGEPVRRVYRDLWVVRLGADGRCTAFEEWPFWPRRGHSAPGR
jgi:ketosteroid isomerase-like protein